MIDEVEGDSRERYRPIRPVPSVPGDVSPPGAASGYDASGRRRLDERPATPSGRLGRSRGIASGAWRLRVETSRPTSPEGSARRVRNSRVRRSGRSPGVGTAGPRCRLVGPCADCPWRRHRSGHPSGRRKRSGTETGTQRVSTACQRGHGNGDGRPTGAVFRSITPRSSG